MVKPSIQQEKQIEFDAIAVKNDQNWILFDPDDENVKIPMQKSQVESVAHIKFAGSLKLVQYFAQQLFKISEIKEDSIENFYLETLNGIKIIQR